MGQIKPRYNDNALGKANALREILPTATSAHAPMRPPKHVPRVGAHLPDKAAAPEDFEDTCLDEMDYHLDGCDCWKKELI